jgi:4-amino-4-deoxy-L-arabinose transferase-like glycosyltransferase
MMLAVLAVFVGVVWFGSVGYRTLTEPDEGRYAEIPREMLATGDWITPQLNGMPYLEKPPLQYWMTAAAYSVFGVSAWVSRLWTITTGLLGIAVIYALGRSLWGAQAGEFAALIAASCPLYFLVGQINLLDTGFAFFLTAGLACFLMAQRVSGSGHDSAKGPDVRRRWMWACWATLALGFLQKGLAALVLPVIALAAYSLVSRDTRPWKRLHLLAGLAIIGSVTLPWLIAVSLRNPEFLRFFFIHEHLVRFTTTIHRRTEPWWYFIGILTIGILPWIPVIARALVNRWRDPAPPGGFHVEKFLVIWAATIVVFFSLSGSKLAPYIVPAIAPLALVAGRWLQVRGAARLMWPVVAISATFLLSLLILRPLVGGLMQPGLKQEVYLQLGAWAQIAGIAGVAGVVIAAFAIQRGTLRIAVAAAAGGLCTTMAVLICASNALEPLRGGSGIAHAIRPHLTAETPFYCVGMYWQSLPFVLQRTCDVAQYQGELGVQFAPGTTHWMPGIDEFAARWKPQRSAVAVVNPKVWPQVQATGLVARVLVQEPNVIVIVKP